MVAAGECIPEVMRCIVTEPCWFNADLSAKLRMETRYLALAKLDLTLAVIPRQAKDLDAHGKLGSLPGAAGKTREPCPAGVECTA